MKLLGTFINPILFQQMSQVFDSKNIYCHKKKDSIKILFSIIHKMLKIKNEKILIYNTSIANIFILFILRINRNKIYFHLHDPIPHSGLLNPIILVVNWILVFLSDEILVFSEKLKNQTRLFYSKSKKINLVVHGTTSFKYEKCLKSTKVIIGFFGRNMPYKKYNKFISFMNNHPELEFITVGFNYPKVSNSNHELFDGVIDNNKYYSLMTDVDYLFFSHSEISFSGVLNDAISFSKSIIIENKFFYKNLNYNNKFLAQKISKFEKKVQDNHKTYGWGEYRSLISKIT